MCPSMGGSPMALNRDGSSVCPQASPGNVIGSGRCVKSKTLMTKSAVALSMQVLATAKAKVARKPNDEVYRVLWTMKWWGVPLVFIQLMWSLLTSPGHDKFHAGLDFVEYFAGHRQVTKANLRRHHISVPYEILDDPQLCDYTGDSGFGFAAELAAMLNPCNGGASLSAPVCSTWVMINVGTSGRSCTRPLGNAHYPSVKAANMMVSRLCLLLMLLSSRGIWWIVEQPRGSLLEHHPRFQELMTVITIYRHMIKMIDYNLPHEKPTWLYSNESFISDIDQHVRPYTGPLPEKATTKRYKDASGRECFTGGPGLKHSQHYTREFGEAVAAVFASRKKELARNGKAVLKEVKKYQALLRRLVPQSPVG
jgi:hypothetical protein